MSDSNVPRCAALELSHKPGRLLYTEKVTSTPSDEESSWRRNVAVLANALGVVGTMIHKLEAEINTLNYSPSAWVATGEAFIILNALQQVKQALVEYGMMYETEFSVDSWFALLYAKPRLLWYGKVQTIDGQSDLQWEHLGLTYDVICPAYKILKGKIEAASVKYEVKIKKVLKFNASP